MVDRVYKSGLTDLRKSLEKLKRELARLDTETNWSKLRVEPLLKHARALEQLLRSPQFSREYSRLRRGVSMFHSDLVYFRDNVRALQSVAQPREKPRTRGGPARAR